MNELYKKTQNNIIKYFISRIVFAVRSLLLLTLYSYLLVPEIYGKYSLIMGIINILLAVFIGWISSSTKRYYENYKENTISFFSNVLVLWFLMNIIMTVIIVFIFRYSEIVSINNEYIYILLTLITISLVMIFENVIRASNLPGYYLFLISIQSLVQLGTFFLLANYLNGDISAIFISLIMSNFIFLFFSIKKVNALNSIDFLSTKDFRVKFFNYGFPMVGVWLVDWLLNLSDRFIIKLYFSNAFVGIYDINYKIASNTIGIFAPTIIMAIFPLMLKSWNNKNEKNVSKLLSHGILLYLTVALPAVLGLIAIKSLLYGSFVSKQYLNGESIIVYTSIALFFYGLMQLLFNIWKLKERPKIIFNTTIVIVLINLILNLIFIPIYGYIFGAISTLIAYFIGFLILTILSRKHLMVSVDFNNVVKILFSSASMFILVTFFIQIININKGIELILSIIIGITIYIIFLSILGVSKDISKWIVELKNR